LPLCYFGAFPIIPAWNINPYFGVFPFFLSALNNAFYAPKIWIVDAGNLLKFTKLPAWEISLAPTFSPATYETFGQTAFILFFK